MTTRLEEQIRRYAEAVDSMAPTVEDLVPPGMAERLEAGESPVVEVTLPLVTPRRRLRLPGWAIGIAAAALALLLIVPLWQWLAQEDVPPADTTPISAPPTPIDAEAIPVIFHLDGGNVAGSGWDPGAELSVSISADNGSFEGTVVVDSDGGFALESPVECCFGFVLTVTDGVTTISGEAGHYVSINRFDPVADLIAGGSDFSGVEAHVEIIGAGGEVLFSDDVVVGNNWSLDLSDVFDVVAGMSATVRVPFGDIWVSATSGIAVEPSLGLEPRENRIQGFGFLPNTSMTLLIDDVELPGGVLSDPGGSFQVDLAAFRMSIGEGSKVEASDGVTIIEVEIPLLSFSVLNETAGIASGEAGIRNGETVQVLIETGPVGSGQEDRQQHFDVPVMNGVWRVEFDPPDPGEEVVGGSVVYTTEDGWIQVNPDLRGNLQSEIDTIVGLDLPEGNIHGQGFPANTTVMISTDGGETFLDVGNTAQNGTFNLPGFVPGPPGTAVVVEIGGTVRSATVPFVQVTSMDFGNDLITGITDVPEAAEPELSLFVYLDQTFRSGEEFAVAIAPDGTWIVNLQGQLDLTAASSLVINWSDPGGILVQLAHDVLVESP